MRVKSIDGLTVALNQIPPTHSLARSVATMSKVVLVTGGNTGLGFHAALALAKMDNAHVIVTGRSLERVQTAVDKIQAEAASSSVVEAGLLDLGDLKGIHEYAAKFKTRGLTIDAVLCNGGVNITGGKTQTVDGFETTFGVNHLGHFYLVSLLRDVTRRVVMVTSETHDPEEKVPVTTPNVSDLEQLAYGYEKYDGHEAYTTSKLCNLLFMKEFVSRYPDGSECISYTPGLVPDTEILRDSTVDTEMLIKIAIEHSIPIHTCEESGRFMARLCADDWTVNGWASDMYIRIDVPHKPSVQAQDSQLARSLWEKSEELITRVFQP